jgi:predicted acylesterase/phospholipase RssA
MLRIVAVNSTRASPGLRRSGFDHVPSRTSSFRVPGLYRPVLIDGKNYIDGGVRKAALSLAIQERCGLVICVNPSCRSTSPAPTSRG